MNRLDRLMTDYELRKRNNVKILIYTKLGPISGYAYLQLTLASGELSMIESAYLHHPNSQVYLGRVSGLELHIKL